MFAIAPSITSQPAPRAWRPQGRIEFRNASLVIGDREVPSRVIGEFVMEELRQLDEVAYVRFASVYLDFKDVQEFMSELKDLIKTKEPEAKPKVGAK